MLEEFVDTKLIKNNVYTEFGFAKIYNGKFVSIIITIFIKLPLQTEQCLSRNTRCTFNSTETLSWTDVKLN